MVCDDVAPLGLCSGRGRCVDAAAALLANATAEAVWADSGGGGGGGGAAVDGNRSVSGGESFGGNGGGGNGTVTFAASAGVCECDSGWTGTSDLLLRSGRDCSAHTASLDVLWAAATVFAAFTLFVSLLRVRNIRQTDSPARVHPHPWPGAGGSHGRSGAGSVSRSGPGAATGGGSGVRSAASRTLRSAGSGARAGGGGGFGGAGGGAGGTASGDDERTSAWWCCFCACLPESTLTRHTVIVLSGSLLVLVCGVLRSLTSRRVAHDLLLTLLVAPAVWLTLVGGAWACYAFISAQLEPLHAKLPGADQARVEGAMRLYARGMWWVCGVFAPLRSLAFCAVAATNHVVAETAAEAVVAGAFVVDALTGVAFAAVYTVVARRLIGVLTPAFVISQAQRALQLQQQQQPPQSDAASSGERHTFTGGKEPDEKGAPVQPATGKKSVAASAAGAGANGGERVFVVKFSVASSSGDGGGGGGGGGSDGSPQNGRSKVSAGSQGSGHAAPRSPTHQMARIAGVPSSRMRDRRVFAAQLQAIQTYTVGGAALNFIIGVGVAASELLRGAAPYVLVTVHLLLATLIQLYATLELGSLFDGSAALGQARRRTPGGPDSQGDSPSIKRNDTNGARDRDRDRAGQAAAAGAAGRVDASVGAPSSGLPDVGVSQYDTAGASNASALMELSSVHGGGGRGRRHLNPHYPRGSPGAGAGGGGAGSKLSVPPPSVSVPLSATPRTGFAFAGAPRSSVGGGPEISQFAQSLGGDTPSPPNPLPLPLPSAMPTLTMMADDRAAAVGGASGGPSPLLTAQQAAAVVAAASNAADAHHPAAPVSQPALPPVRAPSQPPPRLQPLDSAAPLPTHAARPGPTPAIDAALSARRGDR